MKQGGSSPTGKWIGSATGGVKAPQPVLLPTPETRFAGTAARLDALAPNHPMCDWLRFLAELSRVQHAAATMLGSLPMPEIAAIERAVAARFPLLAADECPQDAGWRRGMTLLLDNLDRDACSQRVAAVVDELRSSDEASVEALANRFLQGAIDQSEAAKGLFVAAALQVYFTILASHLPAHLVRLLPQRGQCPCCGSTPVAGVIAASGETPGTRYLYCSLCSTAWNHVRAVCITCGGSGKVALREIEGGTDLVKAETCGDCQTYTKVLYQAKDMRVDPFADDLATLGLDVLVAEAGWARHAPNPLLLVGQIKA